MKKILSKISLAAIVLSSLLVGMPVGASGVTVTLTPNTASTGYQAVTTSWVRDAATTYTTGTTITVTIDNFDGYMFPSEFPASSTSAEVDIDGDGNTDTNFTSTSTGGGTYNSITWTVATTTNSTTTFSVPVDISINYTEAMNLSFAVFVSGYADFGAAMLYVNSGNQVVVTANVPATLHFIIMGDGEVHTNSCALGTLTTAASSTCEYWLRIGTNGSGGFQATIAADADLNSNGNATITQVVDNAASAPGSTEQYGIEVYGASTGGRLPGGTYTGAVTESNPTGFTFGTDTSPVPTSTQDFVSYSDAFSTSPANYDKYTHVKHFANISVGTPAGDYSQTVTYTVTATY